MALLRNRCGVVSAPRFCRGNFVVHWSLRFDSPISVDNPKPVTIGDAAEFIAALPERKQDEPEWREAAESLVHASAHGGLWVELARLSMMIAILAPAHTPSNDESPAKNTTRH